MNIIRKGMMYAGAGLLGLYAVLGCTPIEPPEKEDPEAIISLDKDHGVSPLEIVVDASASISDGGFQSFSFDADGDGVIDYEEDNNNAPDGSFDGIMPLRYNRAGDFNLEVVVTDVHGKSDREYKTIRVGHGSDIDSARQNVREIFSESGFDLSTTNDSVPAPLLQIPDFGDPNLTMHSYPIVAIADNGSEEIAVIYNWDDSSDSPLLSDNDLEIIKFYNSESGLPKVVVLEPEDSPLMIEDKIFEQLPELTIKNPLMHEGVVLTSWWSTDYQASHIDSTLNEIHNLGVESVSILATQYVDDINSPEINRVYTKTPTDEGLERVIGKCKELGMRTVLKPHIDVWDGSERLDITFSNESDWQAWFDNYRTFILHYAQIAADNDVDMFIVGTELKGTVHRSEWQQIISDIKNVYDGEITYAANWDNVNSVSFWNELDYVGVDVYYPLTSQTDPSQAELDAAFAGIAADLDGYSQTYGKRVMVTEIGFQSRDGTNMQPNWTENETQDETEQAHCFEAGFNALFNRSSVAGMYIWQVYHKPDLNPNDFDFIGKEAEVVVNNYFHMED
jgi:hypothetical protein